MIERIIPVVMLIIANLALYIGLNLWVYESWFMWGLVLLILNLLIGAAAGVEDGL